MNKTLKVTLIILLSTAAIYGGYKAYQYFRDVNADDKKNRNINFTI